MVILFSRMSSSDIQTPLVADQPVHQLTDNIIYTNNDMYEWSEGKMPTTTNFEGDTVGTEAGEIWDSNVVEKPIRKTSFGGSANETNHKREIEPLLLPDENRFVMFPIKHNDVWELYQKSVDSFWKAEDVDLSKDLYDWKKLTDDEQNFIKMVLAFFAASDGIIIENLAQRFMVEIQSAEIRAFYAFQNFMENIHSQMYSLLIDTYIQDPDEKMKLFHAVEHYPCIKKKSEWARKWISDGRSSFATRLLGFAIVEGIFFSSSFASIFWIKRKNILPGLCLSNEYISRDEGLHVEHAVLLYRKLKRKVSKKKFIEIMKDAVDIEIEFITVAIPCRMIGMNADLMIEYIKYVCDRLCLQLGYEKIYGAKNSFDFMEFISLESKTSFFEKRVSDYALSNKNITSDVFEFNTEF
jgi:ribonucleotide reductase beta subunit family protein with ferritin-like domain